MLVQTIPSGGLLQRLWEVPIVLLHAIWLLAVPVWLSSAQCTAGLRRKRASSRSYERASQRHSARTCSVFRIIAWGCRHLCSLATRGGPGSMPGFA